MKTFKKTFFVLFAVLLPAAFLFTFSVQAFAEQAYDFTLRDTKGNHVKLSDFKGKVVFLDFWASWCPPCRNSIPAIKNLHKKYAGNADVVILGINVGENSKAVESFMKKNNMEYTILYGSNEVSKKYGISGIPAFFIIDQKGNISKKFVGYASGMEKEWDVQIQALLKQTNK